jgi:hypothetical protein
MDKVFNMSPPVVRAATTIRASPRLASHALIDNMIMHEADTGIKFIVIVKGIDNTRLSVIPSRARRAIRRWFCC